MKLAVITSSYLYSMTSSPSSKSHQCQARHAAKPRHTTTSIADVSKLEHIAYGVHM